MQKREGLSLLLSPSLSPFLSHLLFPLHGNFSLRGSLRNRTKKQILFEFVSRSWLSTREKLGEVVEVYHETYTNSFELVLKARERERETLSLSFLFVILSAFAAHKILASGPFGPNQTSIPSFFFFFLHFFDVYSSYFVF